MFGKIPKVFLVAFAANFFWENFHSVLYVSYQGAAITELVLIKAAVFDALFVTAVFVIVSRFGRSGLILGAVFSLVFAIGLEIFALQTGRWIYSAAMPIVPFLGVGLSPTVQLPLTFMISFWFATKQNFL